MVAVYVILAVDVLTPIAGGGIVASVLSLMGYAIHLNLATQRRADKLSETDHDRLLTENINLREAMKVIEHDRDKWRERYYEAIQT